MDPSIMKLLEDDEDERMHNGADVEAFTAALKDDIGGSSAPPEPPPPSDPNTAGVSLQPISSEQAPQQSLGPWQTFGQEGNFAQQTTHQEENKPLALSQQHQMQLEPMLQGSVSEDKDQEAVRKLEHEQLPLHEGQSVYGHQQRQNQMNHPQLAEQEQPVVSDQHPIQSIMPDKMQNSESQQNLQANGSQQAPAPNQANNAIRRAKVAPTIPFQMLIPMLRPHLDKDRSMQLQSVFNKLKNNEVSKEDFLRVIRNIVGDQMLRQAAHQVQMQLHTQAARTQQLNANQYSLQAQVSSQHLPARGAQSSSDPQLRPAHPITSSQSDQIPNPPFQQSLSTSSGLMQTEMSFATTGSSSHKSAEVESKSDGKGLSSSNLSYSIPEREAPISSFSKQQQSNPSTSFSMYGSSISNFHTHGFPRPSVSGSANSLRQQSLDSQMRPFSLNQGMLSTQIGSTQPINMVNVPQQGSLTEMKRLQGGNSSHLTSSLQHSAIPWQPPVNKEQRSNSFPSMPYVKQENPDHPTESLPATTAKSLNDESTEKQPARSITASASMITPTKVSGPMATQIDPSTHVRSQVSSGMPPGPAGASSKTPAKKPTVGQKKSLEALGTSSPPASKKQKTTGVFHEQSIEQLNDVTAVSGVNLREEEEQLLSGPKEESRASEATRRVVQQEEERLILQKGPLQRKLRDIMSSCGIESTSSDVERCLSMCVEERLRGLVGNLVRQSKQRVDIEKTRHRVVVTSDVRRHILAVNQKAKEEWEKKQNEEAEKLRKLNQVEGGSGSDAEKEKEEGRSKPNKVNKEEDDKMRATAANVAARAAVGGDDMLSKWQLMAEQARQKREGLDTTSANQTAKAITKKSFANPGRTSSSFQEPGKKAPPASSMADMVGNMRKWGRAPTAAGAAHPKVARSISLKDIITALEKEPQMARSTLIYRLYERNAGEHVAD